MDGERVPDSSGNKGGEASTSNCCRKEDIQYRQVTIIGPTPNITCPRGTDNITLYLLNPSRDTETHSTHTVYRRGGHPLCHGSSR